MENEVIISGKHIAWYDQDDQAQPVKKKQSAANNFLDQIYNEFSFNADKVPTSIAGNDSNIGGTNIVLGNIKTMDGGGYMNPDTLAPGLMEVSILPEIQASKSISVTKLKHTEPAYKKWILIIIVVVFCIIFLRGLFAQNSNSK